jgi:regulator of protease activity HflC (stomatin/prohibitin superfamily)
MQAKTSAGRLWPFRMKHPLLQPEIYPMDPFVIALLVLVFLLIASILFFKMVTIFEFQRGLLFRNGRFASILEPGLHFYFSPITSIQRVDIREMNMVLPGQEVLSADNIAMKISLVASYRVADPYRAMTQVTNFMDALHTVLQINLRDTVGSLPVDELLAKRSEIGKAVLEKSVERAKELGLELKMANIRDIMFPGELKNIFAQVVSARNEGLAALERARGESAALRNLANAARLLDGNPSLRQLRLLQMLENKSGNTVILLGDELPGPLNASGKSKRGEQEQLS